MNEHEEATIGGLLPLNVVVAWQVQYPGESNSMRATGGMEETVGSGTRRHCVARRRVGRDSLNAKQG